VRWDGVQWCLGIPWDKLRDYYDSRRRCLPSRGLFQFDRTGDDWG
jgi:hypothetical protein